MAEKIESVNAKSEKLFGAIGLALRARKCLVGTNMCVEEMRKGKGYLLIPANDISDNTKKRLLKTAAFHKIPCLISDVSKNELSQITGKKADTAAVLLTDKGFVQIIEKLGMEIHIIDTEVLNLYGSKRTEI